VQRGYDTEDELEKPGILDPVEYDILTKKLSYGHVEGGKRAGLQMCSMQTMSLLDYLLCNAALQPGTDNMKATFMSDSVKAYYTRADVVEEFELKLRYPALRFRLLDPADAQAAHAKALAEGKGPRKSAGGLGGGLKSGPAVTGDGAAAAASQASSPQKKGSKRGGSETPVGSPSASKRANK
jgi:hypothetical protein